MNYDNNNSPSATAQAIASRIRQGNSAPVSSQPLSQSNPSTSIGYLNAQPGEIIDLMAKYRVWAWALTPNTRIRINVNYPAHILASTAAAVIASAHAVLLGEGLRGTAQGPAVAIASVVQDLTITLGGRRAFGARVTIFDADLTYRPGWYQVALSDGAYSATPGANLGEVEVSSPNNRIEFMMFSIRSVGGQASIFGMADPRVTLVASGSATVAATATTTTVGLAAETLNERDLQH